MRIYIFGELCVLYYTILIRMWLRRRWHYSNRRTTEIGLVLYSSCMKVLFIVADIFQKKIMQRAYTHGRRIFRFFGHLQHVCDCEMCVCVSISNFVHVLKTEFFSLAKIWLSSFNFFSFSLFIVING